MTTADPKLTEPQARALRMLIELSTRPADAHPYADYSVTPAQLARSLWPDSSAWDRETRRFSGGGSGARGGTMPMKAATMLWRLKDRGCATITDTNRWFPTEQGRRIAATIEGGQK